MSKTKPKPLSGYLGHVNNTFTVGFGLSVSSLFNMFGLKSLPTIRRETESLLADTFRSYDKNARDMITKTVLSKIASKSRKSLSRSSGKTRRQSAGVRIHAIDDDGEQELVAPQLTISLNNQLQRAFFEFADWRDEDYASLESIEEKIEQIIRALRERCAFTDDECATMRPILRQVESYTLLVFDFFLTLRADILPPSHFCNYVRQFLTVTTEQARQQIMRSSRYLYIVYYALRIFTNILQLSRSVFNAGGTILLVLLFLQYLILSPANIEQYEQFSAESINVIQRVGTDESGLSNTAVYTAMLASIAGHFMLLLGHSFMIRREIFRTPRRPLRITAQLALLGGHMTWLYYDWLAITQGRLSSFGLDIEPNMTLEGRLLNTTEAQSLITWFAGVWQHYFIGFHEEIRITPVEVSSALAEVVNQESLSYGSQVRESLLSSARWLGQTIGRAISGSPVATEQLTRTVREIHVDNEYALMRMVIGTARIIREMVNETANSFFTETRYQIPQSLIDRTAQLLGMATVMYMPSVAVRVIGRSIEATRSLFERGALRIDADIRRRLALALRGEIGDYGSRQGILRPIDEPTTRYNYTPALHITDDSEPTDTEDRGRALVRTQRHTRTRSRSRSRSRGRN